MTITIMSIILIYQNDGNDNISTNIMLFMIHSNYYHHYYNHNTNHTRRLVRQELLVRCITIMISITSITILTIITITISI